MGGKCGMHGRDDGYVLSFGSKPERRFEVCVTVHHDHKVNEYPT
jgi:hypothetical protein